MAVEDSPEAKQFQGFFNEQARGASKGIKFISTYKEPEPEEPHSSSAYAPAAEPQKQSVPQVKTTQQALDDLIREL